jgi:hypothetical protein
MLDDLEALGSSRWRAVDYDDFLDAPQTVAAKICETFGLTWDRALGQALPLARNTVSPPAKDKWRTRTVEIEAVSPLFKDQAKRALDVLGR